MQTAENLYQYLEVSGCLRRVVVFLVDASASICCGQSGTELDGTIVLGGYEVYARGRSITPVAETWPVELCFHTEHAEDAQAMLNMFTIGSVLRVVSKSWSLWDGEYMFYLDSLTDVERVPDRFAQSFWTILG